MGIAVYSSSTSEAERYTAQGGHGGDNVTTRDPVQYRHFMKYIRLSSLLSSQAIRLSTSVDYLGWTVDLSEYKQNEIKECEGSH